MSDRVGRCHDCTAPQTEVNILSRHILELQNDKEKLIDRCRDLEAQIEKMKCCGNCIHCYEGAYHNGYRCKDHARESVCDNWEMMTDEVRKEMLEDD